MEFLTIVRDLKCLEYRRRATAAGCRDFEKHGKCMEPPKTLYNKASGLLCGYMVNRGYESGCSPGIGFGRTTLLGANRCDRYVKRKTMRRRRRERSTRRQQRV